MSLSASGCREAVRGPLGPYRFIDYATQCYVLAVALIIVLLGRSLPGFYLLLTAHLVCAALIHVLVHGHAVFPQNRLLSALRCFYPVLLYTPLYRETGVLRNVVVDGPLDSFFLALEQRLFGVQPSVLLMEKLPYPAFSELMYASYFSYYVMIVGLAVVLYRRDRGRFFHYVSIVSFIFYLCYLTYIFVPVVGARVFYVPLEGLAVQSTLPHYPLAFPDAVRSGPFFRLMGLIYGHLEAQSAAFPSSHAAVALCALYFSWRYLPRVRAAHGVVVFLLILSTVYCRYHYVVDIFAGAAAGLALLVVGEWLYHRWE